MRDVFIEVGFENPVYNLALYYEKIAYSLSLYLEGKEDAALAYKNSAFADLRKASDSGPLLF